ncbi:MAG: radical SAM protein [bacterium]
MDRTDKYKQSRYNHFVPIEDGKRLAFNAMSCGLAEMDPDSYKIYEALAGGNGDSIDREKHAELIENLKKGGFLIDPELDELAAIRAAHYRARFGNRGFGLTIIPTNNCNFACDYCYENSKIHSAPADQGGVMSNKVCDNIVKLCEQRIEPKGAFAVTWYGGEPLLAPRIIGRLSGEFMRICEEKEAKYQAGIITNGYFLNEKNLSFLLGAKVSFAQVTIDGPREVHDRRRCLKRGGGTYDRVMANLENIDDDRGLRVAIRINIDKRNEDRVPELLEDFKRRGFHKRKNFSMSFGQVFHVAGSCPDISTTCMVTPEFSDFLVTAYKIALDMGFKHTSYPSRMIGNCGAVGSGSALIEPDGTVQNCWETVGHGDKRTGVLESDGIKYDDNYLKWVGWSPFDEECTACDILPLCMSGCPYRSVYPAELGKCISWKYNMTDILPLMKKASEQGLLAVPREACACEIEQTDERR